jgi:hypothetical protein
MIFQAAFDLGLDLSHLVITGDKMSDIEGCCRNQIANYRRYAQLERRRGRASHEVVPDLAGALALLRLHVARIAFE